MDSSLAVQVRNLHKRFRIPGHRPETLKERVVHPLRKVERRELNILDGISFDVRQGEFFGVVGRNGSGKSTLLKLMASIYRADAGTIRIAGRLAPVIELGVGFQQELAAHENIVLNGIMMGLTEAEAEAGCDPVIEFADLKDFVDLKLKNYSSGMRVRLAFATMIQADTDIVLLDEVLAVGDAPFQEKCEEVFRDLRADGSKTIILVSNQMSKIQQYCDRAILIEKGKIARSGPPDEVAEEYTKIIDEKRRSTGRASAVVSDSGPAEPSAARLEQLRLGSADNGRDLDQDEGIQLRAIAVARDEIRRPGFRMQIRDDAHTIIFSMPVDEITGAEPLLAGDELQIEMAIENRLAPGRYQVYCGLTDHGDGKAVPVSPLASAEFIVRQGRTPNSGLIRLRYEVRAGWSDDEAERPDDRFPDRSGAGR